MSFGWVLLGTMGQLMLAYFLFMVVVFSAGGIANGARLGKFHSGMLTLSIYLLPALCLVSAGIVLYLHGHAGSAASYWWYAMPLAATALYLAYAIALSHAR
ncbi:MAG: hypothetical protein ABI870_04905 [Rhodanobacter sp.]